MKKPATSLMKMLNPKAGKAYMRIRLSEDVQEHKERKYQTAEAEYWGNPDTGLCLTLVRDGDIATLVTCYYRDDWLI